MLEAEEQCSIGNIDLSRDLYNKSISSCRTHKYLNDEALAYELGAKFYFRINEYSTSLTHFRLASEKYLAWGAVKKANDVIVSTGDIAKETS